MAKYKGQADVSELQSLG